MRGDVHQLKAPRNIRGHEQTGARYGVIVHSDDLVLSTILVAPTSTSAQPRIFRPTIMVNDLATQVLVEQTAAIDPERLGPFVGHVTLNELSAIDAALLLALALD